jgi:hypothetical protein
MKADFNVCGVSVPEDVQAVVNKGSWRAGRQLESIQQVSCTLDDEQ